ncbi:MAG: class F sortase [Patescibacteria group bacterium]|nr:class F sortase [Patescibacteria group bacterium]
MKKYLLVAAIFIFFLGSIISAFLLKQGKAAPTSVPVARPETGQTEQVSYDKSIPSIQTIQIRPGIPQKLIIDRIGINTAVESVGLDSQGRMDVPTDVNDVGWYNLGVRPGEKGNAVIDGHLDSPSGPAVFYGLSTLGPGDQIRVVDEQGKEYKFIVTDKKIYPYSQVPLNEIFGPSGKPELNLITCGGTWNSSAKNYSDRIVIYSEQSS